MSEPPERFIPSLRDGMERTDYWRNLTERARAVPEEDEMDAEVALRFWAEWLVQRTKDKYDAVVVITGDEGTGKSTLALRLALLCSDLGEVAWRPSEVTFSAVDLVRAYRTVVRGKPVWYDEGVRGTMAGEQMTPEQRSIVKALALVREKGAILFALYPSIWLAAKQIRARRACLWIHVVRRGLGRVHERDRRLNYLPTDALGLAISPRAPHVAWDAFPEDDPAWVEYLATKTAKLNDYLAETERDLKMRDDGSVAPRSKNAERQARWRARHANDPPKGGAT